MSEDKKYAAFWGEFLVFLVFTIGLLTEPIYEITTEFTSIVLMFLSIAFMVPAVIWILIADYRSRIGGIGFLGYIVLLISMFVYEMPWIKMFIILAGGILILYDIASKKDQVYKEAEESGETIE